MTEHDQSFEAWTGYYKITDVSAETEKSEQEILASVFSKLENQLSNLDGELTAFLESRNAAG